MNEAQFEQSLRIPHGPIMQFYNGIKDIELLYPKLRSIQEKVCEERRIFSCIITITQSLSSSDETIVRGTILGLIQNIILPTLPDGFRSTSSDITFVIGQNPMYNVVDTSSESSSNNSILSFGPLRRMGLGIGFLVDHILDSAPFSTFMVPNRGTGRKSQIMETKPLSEAGEGLQNLCEKVQQKFSIIVKCTNVQGTLFFTIYGSAPRDQENIMKTLSENLPKGCSLVVNPHASFSFKTLHDLEMVSEGIEV